MRYTSWFRTFIACAYLLALALHARWDIRTAVLAAAVLTVWAAPAIRDARRARAAVSPVSAR